MIISILAWILFGAFAGWIASMIVGNNESQGALGNIVVGIIGALLGGFIVSLFGVDIESFSILGLLVAIGGAVLLLAIFSSIRHSTTK